MRGYGFRCWKFLLRKMFVAMNMGSTMHWNEISLGTTRNVTKNEAPIFWQSVVAKCVEHTQSSKTSFWNPTRHLEKNQSRNQKLRCGGSSYRYRIFYRSTCHVQLRVKSEHQSFLYHQAKVANLRPHEVSNSIGCFARFQKTSMQAPVHLRLYQERLGLRTMKGAPRIPKDH